MSENHHMDKLIEQSSLGTKHAKKMRASVSAATGRAIVRAAAARAQTSKTTNGGASKKKSN
ncbi:hypothetical protein B7C42_07667 [Nocardia cerradoensis]|uniref:Uncharacterized protein n=1 Tax=Nocardia cerradoensis TaxID=85688 RepID=A0A231GUH4_9NOCA|nr:hypothetical protein [Nocardia cerradoensis]OXR40242.1 hypothetical protein B7C42_07667 [Nocardia cerradoensis]